MRGRPLAFWRDSECRFFLGAVLVLTLLVSFDVYGAVYRSAGQALRYGAFQVVSIVTTTGYATADYEKWPAMSQLILLLCMFLGASAGSTGGGMKCLRVMLCFKFCYKELFLLIHPRAVTHVKIAGKAVPDDVMRSVLGFMSLYMGLFAFSSVLLAGLGVDFMTAVGAVAATIGNVGPGFGMVGPVDNFAQIPGIGQVAADLVHAAGPAGSLHGDHPLGAGILAQVSLKSRPRSKICRTALKFAGWQKQRKPRKIVPLYPSYRFWGNLGLTTGK